MRDATDAHQVDAPKIAVLIPCHNEESTVGKVVADFRAALPDAEIVVCDNASTDATATRAAAAGARVVSQPLRGKGNAVWRLFADVDADLYVLVDGDDTYEAADAPALVARCLSGRFDMVNGARVPVDPGTSRFGHDLGNVALTRMVAAAFGHQFDDMLSGYRVFTRRFVKSFPALSQGFEIETELTVHALELRMPVSEVRTPYRLRPAGSLSKLRTYFDGLRILRTIFVLLKEERPFQFFGVLAVCFALLSVGLALPVLVEFAETGLVPRLPTAVLASALMIVAVLNFVRRQGRADLHRDGHGYALGHRHAVRCELAGGRGRERHCRSAVRHPARAGADDSEPVASSSRRDFMRTPARPGFAVSKDDVHVGAASEWGRAPSR